MAAVEKVDVLVIGAGPSGAIAAALLVRRGYQVTVLEKEVFPRFSIGESLLPQCMQYIEEAGMMDAVHAGGFQHKNGAAFQCNGQYAEVDFTKKFSQGWGTTYQVERASFDKILADEAQRMSADVRYGHEIVDVNVSTENPSVSYRDAAGDNYALLGNAGEFLDPIFSSGVTIGMRSASMAAALVDRQLKGEHIDWDVSFSRPLMIGVDSFRTYVTGWYDQRFQDVIFFERQQENIKAMISSILAGYAWDESNPYVRDSERRFKVLAEICKAP